jgi:hypothetical protein
MRPASAYASARSRTRTAMPGCACSHWATVVASRSGSTVRGRRRARSRRSVPSVWRRRRATSSRLSPCGATSAGQGARRITRHRGFRRTVRPKAWLSRAPAAPPSARPRARRRGVNRHVCRAQGATLPGSGAVQIRQGHVRWRQQNWRTRSRHATLSPRHGRSASVRRSRLGPCGAGVSQAGHRAFAGVEERRRVIWAWGSSGLQASS